MLFYRREAEVWRGKGLGGGLVAKNGEPGHRLSLLNPTFCFVMVFHQTKSLSVLVLAQGTNWGSILEDLPGRH